MSLQPYAAIHFFTVQLNKKYIGQFTYYVGNPVRCPLFIVITLVCFDLLTPNLLSGSFGLPLRYLGARSRLFTYNRIFSFYSITSVHFDLLIAVTSKLGR
jgi:hypothetical protein